MGRPGEIPGAFAFPGFRRVPTVTRPEHPLSAAVQADFERLLAEETTAAVETAAAERVSRHSGILALYYGLLLTVTGVGGMLFWPVFFLFAPLLVASPFIFLPAAAVFIAARLRLREIRFRTRSRMFLR